MAMNSSTRTAEILTKAGVIDELQVRSALARQQQWGGRLSRHVVEMGFSDESKVVEALSKALALQKVELAGLPRDAAALAKMDAEFAEQRGIFPFSLRDNGKTLWVAMADPCDLETVDVVVARSGCRVRTAVAGERDILGAIYRHYRNQEVPARLLAQDMRLSAGPAPTTDEFKLTDMAGNTIEVSTAGNVMASAPRPAPLPQEAMAIPVPMAPTSPARAYPTPASLPAMQPAPVPAGRTYATPAALATPVPPAARPYPVGGIAAPAPQSGARAFPTPAAVPNPLAQGGVVQPMRVPTPLPGSLAAPQEDLAEQVRRLQTELDKATKVLRGIVELCVEKNVFSNDEVRAAIARLSR